MQLLAADQEAPGRHVGAGVLGRPVAIAPEVADAVDHAGRPEGDPGDLHDEDQASQDAEEHEVDERREHQAAEHVLRVDVALEPVVGRAVAEALERLGIGGLLAVEEHPAPQHAVDAVDLRAVRILRRLDARMVLAVHRHPFARLHAGGEPEPQAEEVADRRMQLERAMRLAAVQEDGDGHDGDVGQPGRRRDIAPPGKVERAVEEEMCVHVTVRQQFIDAVPCARPRSSPACPCRAAAGSLPAGAPRSA